MLATHAADGQATTPPSPRDGSPLSEPFPPELPPLPLPAPLLDPLPLPAPELLPFPPLEPAPLLLPGCPPLDAPPLDDGELPELPPPLEPATSLPAPIGGSHAAKSAPAANPAITKEAVFRVISGPHARRVPTIPCPALLALRSIVETDAVRWAAEIRVSAVSRAALDVSFRCVSRRREDCDGEPISGQQGGWGT